MTEIDYRELAIQQQRIIKDLLTFTITSITTLETISATFKELQASLDSLETVHGNLKDDVHAFLTENEIDNRETEGGTG